MQKLHLAPTQSLIFDCETSAFASLYSLLHDTLCCEHTNVKSVDAQTSICISTEHPLDQLLDAHGIKVIDFDGTHSVLEFNQDFYPIEAVQVVNCPTLKIKHLSAFGRAALIAKLVWYRRPRIKFEVKTTYDPASRTAGGFYTERVDDNNPSMPNFEFSNVGKNKHQLAGVVPHDCSYDLNSPHHQDTLRRRPQGVIPRNSIELTNGDEMDATYALPADDLIDAREQSKGTNYSFSEEQIAMANRNVPGVFRRPHPGTNEKRAIELEAIARANSLKDPNVRVGQLLSGGINSEALEERLKQADTLAKSNDDVKVDASKKPGNPVGKLHISVNGGKTFSALSFKTQTTAGGSIWICTENKNPVMTTIASIADESDVPHLAIDLTGVKAVEPTTQAAVEQHLLNRINHVLFGATKSKGCISVAELTEGKANFTLVDLDERGVTNQVIMKMLGGLAK